MQYQKISEYPSTLIYKLQASVQTVKRFQDLSKYKQILHIITNTFVVNHVRSDEK